MTPFMPGFDAEPRYSIRTELPFCLTSKRSPFALTHTPLRSRFWAWTRRSCERIGSACASISNPAWLVVSPWGQKNSAVKAVIALAAYLHLRRAVMELVLQGSVDGNNLQDEIAAGALACGKVSLRRQVQGGNRRVDASRQRWICLD